MRRKYYQLDVEQQLIRLTCVSASGDTFPQAVEHALPGPLEVEPDELQAATSTLFASLGGGLRVQVRLNDDIVRYFMVVPPVNGIRMQDLEASAAMRFQMLYGELVSSWRLIADWQVNRPFLACAVPRSLLGALNAAATAQRTSLISVMPIFVDAWNHFCKNLSPDAWPATLNDRTLTLGVVAGSVRPGLSAVRTLKRRGDSWSAASLRQEIVRAALIDDVPPPAVVHIQSRSSEAFEAELTPTQGVIDLRVHRVDVGAQQSRSDGASTHTEFAQNGAMT